MVILMNEKYFLFPPSLCCSRYLKTLFCMRALSDVYKCLRVVTIRVLADFSPLLAEISRRYDTPVVPLKILYPVFIHKWSIVLSSAKLKFQVPSQGHFPGVQQNANQVFGRPAGEMQGVNQSFGGGGAVQQVPYRKLKEPHRK